ncbi:alpha/beta fold hydrolase [Streptomyces bohaiensis]|uniref:Alpha/beta fold hydrolase n=3 Tax=Streptomyces bohaiensis TaxID=1431344 RepID=A0ABX1CD39_9ACTN|nr:alpha/beta fold hydrolase [Streptomyces bohaiensis]NJQ15823.1 alpha/beta fold hydrolase [Streptomyces bohaiensis]
MSEIYRTEAGGEEVRRRYRAALDAWPVPSERLTVATSLGDTFVLAAGPEEAPPVVLLHGACSNALTWQGAAPGWSRQLRTYAVDLPGEPGLSTPARPALDSDAPAHWLTEVLDGLGLDTPALVGASLGGWTALDFAIRRPDRVSRLALLAPGGVGPARFAWLLRWAMLRPFGEWGRRRSAADVAGLDPVHDREVLDELSFVMSEFKPRTEKLPVFADELLARLEMPTLVLCGARDAMFDSLETARRFRKRVPRAEVVVLPHAGHAVLDQADAVRRFLTGPVRV